MDLHMLLDRVSKILTPNTDYFYTYALHTFDNNGGFLQTRYCWWEKCLENNRSRSVSHLKYKIVFHVKQ